MSPLFNTIEECKQDHEEKQKVVKQQQQQQQQQQQTKQSFPNVRQLNRNEKQSVELIGSSVYFLLFFTFCVYFLLILLFFRFSHCLILWQHLAILHFLI